jgi:S-adenosylmethionine:tRNA ribosyltransferase-isomerase
VTAALDLLQPPDAADTIPFDLRPELEAHEPPEARGTTRDDVRLLVSRTVTGELDLHAFAELPDLLLPGDLVVVNNSATLPAAITLPAAGSGATAASGHSSGMSADHPSAVFTSRSSGASAGHASAASAVHFSTAMPDGDWLVELRSGRDGTSVPFQGGEAGDQLELPGGAVLTLGSRFSARLWHARLSTAVIPYLLRHGRPIRYSYVPAAWPIDAYQTIFATWPGSAEMPSAARPFTPEIVTRLVSRGIAIAPITLHTGVSSLEGDEDPYPESFDVPAPTARLVNLTRRAGGRVIAAGTTVVRALESAALGGCPAAPTGSRYREGRYAEGQCDGGRQDGGTVRAAAGWTSHVVTRQTGVAVVDGLLTGLHEPRSTHLWMLAAFTSEEMLRRSYRAAADAGFRWHEFGDVHLLLP